MNCQSIPLGLFAVIFLFGFICGLVFGVWNAISNEEKDKKMMDNGEKM